MLGFVRIVSVSNMHFQTNNNIYASGKIVLSMSAEDMIKCLGALFRSYIFLFSKPFMSTLESELDIIVLDENEMEEIGKSLVQGACTVPMQGSLGMNYEEILKNEMQNNSVMPSHAFEEIFNKELRWKSTPDPSDPMGMDQEKDSPSTETSLIKAFSYHKKGNDVHTVLREKKNKSTVETHFGSLGKRSTLTQTAGHWTRTPAINKSETYTPSSKTEGSEIFTGYPCALPSVGTGPSDSIYRVSIETVSSLLGKSEFILIDCRFEYEYTGGHITSAVNITTQKEIKKLFDELVATGKGSSLILIFYCEYSSVRAPRLAISLRNQDRLKSAYPYLRFPNVYVMEGGYRDFYKSYPGFCVPCSYIPM